MVPYETSAECPASRRPPEHLQLLSTFKPSLLIWLITWWSSGNDSKMLTLSAAVSPDLSLDLGIATPSKLLLNHDTSGIASEFILTPSIAASCMGLSTGYAREGAIYDQLDCGDVCHEGWQPEDVQSINEKTVKVKHLKSCHDYCITQAARCINQQIHKAINSSS